MYGKLLSLFFFPGGSVYEFVKNQGVHTDNAFSFSAVIITRRLIVMIIRNRLPLYKTLLRPHLGYGVQDCSQNPVASWGKLPAPLTTFCPLKITFFNVAPFLVLYFLRCLRIAIINHNHDIKYPRLSIFNNITSSRPNKPMFC